MLPTQSTAGAIPVRNEKGKKNSKISQIIISKTYFSLKNF